MFAPVKIVRFWLPALIFVIGAAMLVISPDIVGLEGAALMLGGGLGVVVSNRIHQMGIKGEKDRDDEMGARHFMERYGVWPDEASEEVLDRAERAGDIEPRTPAAGSPPDDVPPPRVDPHSRPARTATGADGRTHSANRRTGPRTGRRAPRR
ncbi:hypothetical protein [Patulibacter sp.]|uniref:hypothetical protein n=1 Tax=Patulibacter sp. TaxID=1912859 RepID=UPI002717488F|nr:hypothetical protein [Patulibacter sp.]MDO9407191.1 hypothetical protein [Patulibacter sp.]